MVHCVVRLESRQFAERNTHKIVGRRYFRERERDKTTTFNLNRLITFGLKQRTSSWTKHCVTSKKYVIDYEPAFVHRVASHAVHLPYPEHFQCTGHSSTVLHCLELLLWVHTGADQVILVDPRQQEQKKQLMDIVLFVQFNDQVCLVAPSLGVVFLPAWSGLPPTVSENQHVNILWEVHISQLSLNEGVLEGRTRQNRTFTTGLTWSCRAASRIMWQTLTNSLTHTKAGHSAFSITGLDSSVLIVSIGEPQCSLMNSGV